MIFNYWKKILKKPDPTLDLLLKDLKKHSPTFYVILKALPGPISLRAVLFEDWVGSGRLLQFFKGSHYTMTLN